MMYLKSLRNSIN